MLPRNCLIAALWLAAGPVFAAGNANFFSGLNHRADRKIFDVPSEADFLRSSYAQRAAGFVPEPASLPVPGPASFPVPTLLPAVPQSPLIQFTSAFQLPVPAGSTAAVPQVAPPASYPTPCGVRIARTAPRFGSQQ